MGGLLWGVYYGGFIMRGLLWGVYYEGFIIWGLLWRNSLWVGYYVLIKLGGHGTDKTIRNNEGYNYYSDV